MTKIRKSANNQVMHKFIHIIHKDNHVDELIYINKFKHMFCVKFLKLLTFLNSKYHKIYCKKDII